MSLAARRVRILYVEDDEGDLQLVRRLLPADRFEIVQARSALEAVSRVPLEAPDLVLIDLEQPGLDGPAVVTRLRRLPELAEVPFVAVTSAADRERAFALGCQGFVEKPFDLERFAEQVQEYLGARRDHAPAASREPELAPNARGVVDDLERRVQELAQANERLEELERRRREFIQNITHELATPLTPILGYLRLLRSERAGSLTPLQRRCVESMDVSSRRLKLLIDDLLDITRIEAGEFALVVSEVRPEAIASEAVEMVASQAEAKSITIERLSKGDGTIQVDAGKVLQALTHVLRNAVKFTPEGGKALVESRCLPDGSAEFFVYDTGIGIPADQLERVFDPFFQIDGSMTRRFGGVGIGLTIARRLVEAHGGRVWAESPPAEQPKDRYYRGTRVGISLPHEPPPTARRA